MRSAIAWIYRLESSSKVTGASHKEESKYLIFHAYITARISGWRQYMSFLYARIFSGISIFFLMFHTENSQDLSFALFADSGGVHLPQSFPSAPTAFLDHWRSVFSGT